MCDIVAPILVVFNDEALTHAFFSHLMERMLRYSLALYAYAFWAINNLQLFFQQLSARQSDGRKFRQHAITHPSFGSEPLWHHPEERRFQPFLLLLQMVFVGLQARICLLWYLSCLGNDLGIALCDFQSLLLICGDGSSRKLQVINEVIMKKTCLIHFSKQGYNSWPEYGLYGHHQVFQWDGWETRRQDNPGNCPRSCEPTPKYNCWSIKHLI